MPVVLQSKSSQPVMDRPQKSKCMKLPLTIATSQECNVLFEETGLHVNMVVWMEMSIWSAAADLAGLSVPGNINHHFNNQRRLKETCILLGNLLLNPVKCCSSNCAQLSLHDCVIVMSEAYDGFKPCSVIFDKHYDPSFEEL